MHVTAIVFPCQVSLSIRILVCKGFLVPTERTFWITVQNGHGNTCDEIGSVFTIDPESSGEWSPECYVPMMKKMLSGSQDFVMSRGAVKVRRRTQRRAGETRRRGGE